MTVDLEQVVAQIDAHRGGIIGVRGSGVPDTRRKRLGKASGDEKLHSGQGSDLDFVPHQQRRGQVAEVALHRDIGKGVDSECAERSVIAKKKATGSEHCESWPERCGGREQLVELGTKRRERRVREPGSDSEVRRLKGSHDVDCGR
ncbi:hypothetical protein ACH3VR_07605 [Microbacterium sp. B2969]|uniref:Uncharacterized protein n=1 Tax=Microbacterium alkaliflavum TaxID=3248839 RepID=A0ABW7Q9J3_9MICO